MPYFVLGSIFGALCVYVTRMIEKTTGDGILKATNDIKNKIVKHKPIIIEGLDPTDKFIDENFDVKRD